jgi:superoxide dismutase
MGGRGRHGAVNAEKAKSSPLPDSLILQLPSQAPNAGGKPGSTIGPAIDSAFGSFDSFKEGFSNAAATVFG